MTAVCALSLSIAQVNAEERFLADDRMNPAETITTEFPARSTRLAAAELQTYVAKIFGEWLTFRSELSVDVPVQIYVGESTHAAKLGIIAAHLEHSAYRIVSGENWLALIGDDTDFTLKEPWTKNNSGRDGRLIMSSSVLTNRMLTRRHSILSIHRYQEFEQNHANVPSVQVNWRTVQRAAKGSSKRTVPSTRVATRLCRKERGCAAKSTRQRWLNSQSSLALPSGRIGGDCQTARSRIIDMKSD